MNFFSALSWMWKAFRDHSVTFAVLLAFALLGVSVFAGLRDGLRAVHAPWLVTFLMPAVLVGLLARKEREWIPDEAKRRRWARGIVGVAIVLAMIAAKLASVFSPHTERREAPEAQRAGEIPQNAPTRPHGPSGK